MVKEAKKKWKEWGEETKCNFQQEADGRKAAKINEGSSSRRWLQESAGSRLPVSAAVDPSSVSEQSGSCEKSCASPSPSVSSCSMSGAHEFHSQAKLLNDGLVNITCTRFLESLGMDVSNC